MIQVSRHAETRLRERCGINRKSAQSRFIYENELLTTVHILSDELAKLRSQKGL